MKISLKLLMMTLSLTVVTGASAVGTVGQVAPDFSAKDTAGRPVKLSDFKGKHVVLEWVNPNCPFVKKHYEASANMQDTQKEVLAKKDTVWLAINSTNTSHQDYMTPSALDTWMKARGAKTTAVLMDESGAIGKSYGAKTTPHMYIIDPKGTLVYAGGIDSIRSASVSDIAKATNFVKVAMEQTHGGKAISTATSIPYGCSVKYKD
jgi:peroxiredoxin